MRGSAAALALAAVVLATVTAARAEAAGLAYVDEIDVHGDVTAEAARGFVTRLLSEAGMDARHRDGSLPPCDGAPRCLEERGREAHAAIAVRATVLGLASEVSVSLFVVVVETGRSSGLRRSGVDLAGTDDSLSAFVRQAAGGASDARARPRRVAAWILTGATFALGAGAAWALVAADAREDQFFADHVDAAGSVYGITPEDAAEHEAKTRDLALLGTLLMAGAAATGVTATILFLHDPSTERSRDGVVVGVAGRF